jgi:hypothetical protein
MARRTKAYWDGLIAEYAKAFQETNIKAQAWYESVVNDGLWGSAKRHITTKNAKAYLEGDTNESQSKEPAKKSANKSANNRKTTANKSQSLKQSANKEKSQTVKGKTAKPKSLINKKKKTTPKAAKDKKALPKDVSADEESQLDNATAKRTHGAFNENPEKSSTLTSDARPFIEDEMCGAMTRMGHRCRKESGWGTAHIGDGRCRLHGGNNGAKPRNQNATVHGIYSQYLDDDELEIFNSQSAVELDLSPEIARVRIELKRCYEKAAIQRDIAGGAKGYFQWNVADSIKELDSTEEAGGIPEQDEEPERSFDGGLDFNIEFETPKKTTANASVSKFVIRDYSAIADKLIGRLASLLKQQSQLDSFIPREESLELLEFFLSEYEANTLSAKQVALNLSKFGIKPPAVIDIAARAEIEVEGAGISEGLSDAELDAMVEQDRAAAQEHFDKNMENRDEIVARMIAGESIDLEDYE